MGIKGQAPFFSLREECYLNRKPHTEKNKPHLQGGARQETGLLTASCRPPQEVGDSNETAEPANKNYGVSSDTRGGRGQRKVK